MFKPVPTFALAAALTLGSVGTALGGNAGGIPSLPGCLGSERTDGACLLPLENGSFDVGVLASWSVRGRPYPAPAHMLVNIDNDGATPATVQVDDVVLIENDEVEVLDR